MGPSKDKTSFKKIAQLEEKILFERTMDSPPGSPCKKFGGVRGDDSTFGGVVWRPKKKDWVSRYMELKASGDDYHLATYISRTEGRLLNAVNCGAIEDCARLPGSAKWSVTVKGQAYEIDLNE